MAAELTKQGEPAQEAHTNPAASGTDPAGAGWPATLFVAAVWAGMLLAALAFVWNYGRNVPFWPDEWAYAEVLTGRQPVTLKWLWERHFEHRLVLPKLIWVGLLRLTGCDFRAGMYGNVLLLGVLALALILAARRLRGRTSYADAFFPLALLHLGHWDNFLWAWQIQFVSSTFLAGALLLTIVRSGAPLHWKGTCLAGTCLVLLPVCGANGVAFVPALALWLAYAGALRWGSPPGAGGKRDALLAWAFAAAALLIVALFVLGYERPNHRPTDNGVWRSLTMATQFFGASLGLGPGQSWLPYSGLVVVGLLLLGVALLARAWLKRPQERSRAAGLLFFLGGLACLALGLGWGREEIYSRYVTLAAPALCCAYFVAGLYGGRGFGRLLQGSLLALLLAALPFNVRDGLDQGRERREALEGFARDVRAGAPLHEVAERHAHDVYWHGGTASRKEFADRLAVLQEAGMGPYRLLKRDPAAEAALVGDDSGYQREVAHVRQVVNARLPRGAIVVFVSHGDDDLLELEGGRRGWHFPQTEDGTYTRNKPGGAPEIVAHLEQLWAKGAQYIVFPKTAFWWLEDYPDFKRYPERNCQRIYSDDDCTIYQLPPKG